ncbi:MAG: prolyl-tRNA synthetase associated domain-containing protein [Oscillospiraceae bacterium]
MEQAIKYVLDLLDKNGISYQYMEHQPVYTIEDMLHLHLDEAGEIPKNLFLRNANGKQHYLVIVGKEKHVNLKVLREVIGSTALSFASEERLQKHLGLSKGAVTPFGVLNNADCSVEVLFDRDLTCAARLGFHPNCNTATVFLLYRDVESIIQSHGNPIRVVEIPAGESSHAL